MLSGLQEDSQFTMQDLVIAYRKAKADLFYTSNARYLDIAKYEESLYKNLLWLREQLNSKWDNKWIDESFVGDYRVIPKSVTVNASEQPQQNHIYANPWDYWDSAVEETSQSEVSGSRVPHVQASFRLMSHCSIHMHVLSALWMREVGIELDGLLSPAAFGNRLRRDRHDEYNDWSLGTFKKYLGPYKKWRDDGFRAIEEALVKDKDVYCLTADATEFFHRIDPDFLDLDSQFLRTLEIDYQVSFNPGSPKRRIHGVFIASLKEWQRAQESSLRTLHANAKVMGLPVGLPASGLVANMALLEFDRTILSEMRPLYYGRYVDDIMLVWEDMSKREKTAPVRNITDVWKWFRKVSSDFCVKSDSDKTQEHVSDTESRTGGSVLRFAPEYLDSSRVEFSSDKNRLYSMGGTTGLNLLAKLRATTEQRSSEWRMMPELPISDVEVGASVSKAWNVHGEDADGFSGLEGVSMSRSDFALLLRDYEAIARDVELKSWTKQRSVFFRAISDYVLTPTMVLEMDNYLERVFILALQCNEYEIFTDLVEKFIEAATSVQGQSSLYLTGITHYDERIRPVDKPARAVGEQTELRRIVKPAWLKHIYEKIDIAIDRTGTSLPEASRKILESVISEHLESWTEGVDLQTRFVMELPPLWALSNEPIFFTEGKGSNFERLFHRDLAAEPFRNHLLPNARTPGEVASSVSGDHRKENPLGLIPEVEGFREYFELLDSSLKDGRDRYGFDKQPEDHQSAAATGDDNKMEWPNLSSLWGLVFPTRPFQASELFDISELLRVKNSEVQDTAFLLRNALLMARGYGTETEPLERIRRAPINEVSERIYINLSTGHDQLARFNKPISARSPLSPVWEDIPSVPGDGHKVRIAVAMLETPKKFISAALHQKPNLSAPRYRKLTRLVNETIRLQPKPDYLVLGELALPREWFSSVAMKLASAGINLISGVEYIHSDETERVVHNQVWASLLHTTLGHRIYSPYKQDKQSAAHGERKNLLHEKNLRLAPESEWTTPPIIRHENHFFGLLICSELTNIHHRASFSGKVDTLFVPQWNQDLNTFSALVESAALDVHAHIVQVNNRIHGDTRIRIPANDSWRRDVVQLKGGLNDYVVVAELDLDELRTFQTKFSSPDSPYKPLPDGFDQDASRSRVEGQ